MMMLIRVLPLMLLTLLAPGERGTVVNPRYTSWTKWTPGTWIVSRVTTTTEQGQTFLDVTETLVEVADDAVTLDVKLDLDPAVVGWDKLGRTRRVRVPARVQLEDTLRAQIPALISGDIEQTGNEAIQAVGKRRSCKVFSFTAELAGLKYEGKMWRCDDVPEGVVKADIGFSGAIEGTMVLELLSIARK